MDGFSGYNQIKMAPDDMEKTTFVTQWGTFCYKVMPFGLKNAGATYQRAMVALFHDVIRWENWLEFLRLYSHLFGLARVATGFLFYPKGKVKKAQQKPFEIFRGFGG